MIRPLLRGRVLAGDGSWVQTPFLVDTGADRTVLSANILAGLRVAPVAGGERLSGAGGELATVAVQTRMEFPREDGVMVGFQGQFAAATDPEALDMSVLGRDVTNAFAVIVDRPGDVVCLLAQRHRYRVEVA
jgi:hypothetical protein